MRLLCLSYSASIAIEARLVRVCKHPAITEDAAPGTSPRPPPRVCGPGQTSVSHKMHHGQNGESSPYPREWWPHPKSQCAFLYNCTLRALELYTLSCALMGLPRTMRGMMSGSMCTQMARISTKKAAAMCMQNWPDRTPLPSPNVATT